MSRLGVLFICWGVACEGRGAGAETSRAPGSAMPQEHIGVGPNEAVMGGDASDTSRSGNAEHARADALARVVELRDRGALRVEALDGEEPPIFVVQSGTEASTPKRGRLVFLHGMCGHGLGYAQSFQNSAARRGELIAPQADVSCGGVWAKWSMDVETLDARIVRAFEKLGHSPPIDDITVIGMSQGATRAAWLARKYPERYTRLISMGAPTVVKASEVRRLRAAVTMVGERERKDLARQSAQSLQALGVPATTMIIPDADHAGMGNRPEETMDAALRWLEENERPKSDPSSR